MGNFSDKFAAASGNNLIEEIQACCDGSSYTVSSGTYTPESVTGKQTSNDVHTKINGSAITYTPPTGAKYVFYNFRFMINPQSNNQHSGHSSYKLHVGGTEVTAARKHFSTNYHASYGHGIQLFDVGFVFDLTAATNDVANGKFSDWTDAREIKVTGRRYNSTYTVDWHANKWRDGGSTTSTSEWTRPMLTIKATK